MGWPPHPQTAQDREALTALFPLFKALPENFEFPIAVDPNYIPPVNSCSILHLLLRLAHLQSTTQRWYLRTVLGFSYVFLFACVLVEIFECGTPVSRTFELRHAFDGTCVGSSSVAVYGGLIAGHMGLDALTIFPPLLVLARLPLAPGKKFNLSFLLVLGVLTMVFSAVRLFVFYQIMVSSYDITWHATAVAFWGVLESSLAAIIACLPALNQAMIRQVKRLYPRREGSSALSNRFGVNGFERNNIYKGPAKFVSYSADATVSGGTGTMRDYVELGDLNSEEALRSNAAAAGGGGDEGGGGEERTRTPNVGDSYADITVERSFYVIEERAEDLEAQEQERIRAQEGEEEELATASVAKPARARLFGVSRRPSPPSRSASEKSSDAASKV
ncbi:hypothetical protein Dda_3035 [Drechslerella dactyloides]|uniref:Rhodopsin domain-containing protein n=1 Tax=Drechslerella dactyloides TaxID=74499 RepID=A0AAD6J2X5_DREDA|nr:hypothetical protein Dda_3035 [Drechslerella dactyloides]